VGNETRIERVSMDGANRSSIVNTDLGTPNGITIDYTEQRIYWTDALLGRIEYSNVNGSGRFILEDNATGLIDPFAITLEGDLLFWTERSENRIFFTHKLLPENMVLINYLPTTPYGIEAVIADRQMNGNTD
jgi:low density lipoprotein-related protein 2